MKFTTTCSVGGDGLQMVILKGTGSYKKGVTRSVPEISQKSSAKYDSVRLDQMLNLRVRAATTFS